MEKESLLMSEERITGIVKWVSSEKGFGFIKTHSVTYMFLPDSAIQARVYRDLFEGDRVTFVVIQDQKGPQASQVARTN